ncbi:hypothetical protein LPY66_07655 [Dehalobacter sp. DCM]|uniref:hypothetical protein n=1 Tax=Dehalobacter sp. DCM TaxID=2907827 RepID=UPI00308152D8|nr:hypothetical protein LPY66_07655 [Dehalobacter sp. DCM]
MNPNDEVVLLNKRIMELEKQLDNLRLSRRVLMDLLEQLEKDKKILNQKLEQKTKQLQRYRKHGNGKQNGIQEFELLEFKNYMRE